MAPRTQLRSCALTSSQDTCFAIFEGGLVVKCSQYSQRKPPRASTRENSPALMLVRFLNEISAANFSRRSRLSSPKEAAVLSPFEAPTRIQIPTRALLFVAYAFHPCFFLAYSVNQRALSGYVSTQTRTKGIPKHNQKFKGLSKVNQNHRKTMATCRVFYASGK